MGFMCMLKMYHVRFFIVIKKKKKKGLKRLPYDMGFIPNFSHYYKKLAFHMLLKPQLRIHTLARVHKPRATLVI